jgi:hypothetical protein
MGGDHEQFVKWNLFLILSMLRMLSKINHTYRWLRLFYCHYPVVMLQPLLVTNRPKDGSNNGQ